jgi:hypothetical protein
MTEVIASRSSPRRALLSTVLLGGALLLGFAAPALAQSSCGTPPSGLVRLWTGIGCTGSTEDMSASGPVPNFPTTSLSNGTGQWIAVYDAADPSQANHTLFVQNGCYYPDLALFQWQGGGTWAGMVRGIQILPPGSDPAAYPAPGKVIGRCE